GTKFFVDLDDSAAGAGTGYDQLVVDGGTLDLNDATLTGLATANVDEGDTFTIITAINGGPITRRVHPVLDPHPPRGAAVYISGQKFLVTYSSTEVKLTRVLASVTVDLSSSHNPSPFGEDVTFTATVTPEDAATFDTTPPSKVRFAIDTDGDSTFDKVAD